MRTLSKAVFLLSLLFASALSTTTATAKAHRRVGRRAPHRVIECVGFIHLATNFQIHGNAKDWWVRAAAKHYERGHVPEVASVLSFKPSGTMVLGHVALVKKLIDDRTILIDHAHWGSSGITRNITVVDVSRHNNWSKVRVSILHHPDLFGRVYPTNGFIYPRFEVRSDTHEVRARDIMEAKWRGSRRGKALRVVKKNEESPALIKSGVLENGPYKSL